jgi:hypothetical protein
MLGAHIHRPWNDDEQSCQCDMCEFPSTRWLRRPRTSSHFNEGFSLRVCRCEKFPISLFIRRTCHGTGTISARLEREARAFVWMMRSCAMLISSRRESPQIRNESRRREMMALIVIYIEFTQHTSELSHCHVSSLSVMIDSAGESWQKVFVECRERLTR